MKEKKTKEQKRKEKKRKKKTPKQTSMNKSTSMYNGYHLFFFDFEGSNYILSLRLVPSIAGYNSSPPG